MQTRNPIQVRKEEHRTCPHILQELNMQAQILYKSKFVQYPPRIEHAGTSYKFRAHILRELNMQARKKRYR